MNRGTHTLLSRSVVGALRVGLLAWTLLTSQASADSGVAVVDLSEDLVSRSVNGPPSLEGRNEQATLLRLRQGRVAGVVLWLHEPRAGITSDVSQETAFLDLGRFLSRSTSFQAPGCRNSPDRIQTWLALDGGFELAHRSERIPLWVTRGVRIFGLVGETDNDLATSWTDPPPGPVVGLSTSGRDVVRRIYRAGGVVDITSASALARDDVIAIARTLRAPVVALSANARALADDLARALIASGMSHDDVERVFARNALRVLCPAQRMP